MTWARCAPGVATAHRLLLGAVLAAALGASLAPGAPLVAWLAGWAGGSLGHGAAAAQALPVPAAPIATVAGGEVTVHWEGVTLAGGTPVGGYQVRRYSEDGVEQPVGTGCAGTVAGPLCTETDVAPGRWRYTVTAVQAQWVGDESAPSASAEVGAARLVLTGTTTIESLPATVIGTLSGFAAGDALTFRLDSPTGPVLAGSPSVVGGDGTATVSVVIPAGTDDDPHDIVVIGSGGAVARAPITVVDGPTLAALEAFDVDGNGRLDQVTATFDEPLAPYGAGTAPWSLESAPDGIALAAVTVSGAVATLVLDEGTAVTTAVGGFRVGLARDRGGIRDLDGHPGSFAATPVQDRAAPVPRAAPQVLDVVGPNGRVDRITVPMSEALAAPAADPGGISLVGAPSGASVGGVTVSADVLTIALAEGPGAADTSAGSSTVALAASGGVADAAGNPATFGPTALRDGAAPFPVTRLGFDADADGRFDRVTATFSEPLASYAAPVSVWSLGAVPSGGTLAGVSVLGDTATLVLAEGPGAATTAVSSSFHLGIAAHAEGVRDAAGNRTALTGGPMTTVEDRAAPQPLAASLLDVTEDGRVDRLTLSWTEPLDATPSDIAPWLLSDVPSGGTIAAATSSGSTSTLTLAEGAGPPDTAVGAMTVALASSPTGVSDPAGNRATVAALTPIDAARPVPIAVGGVDGATDGRIEPGDTLTVTLSEPLTAASVPTSTTVGLADRPGGGNDLLDLPGITAGARETGSTLYLTSNNRDASFASPVALSPEGTTITVTVGPTCSGRGCDALGTATVAADLSLLLAPTLADRAGLAPRATARTFAVRLF